MKTIVAAFTAALAAAVSSLACASVAWQGTLSGVHFMASGAILVYTSGSLLRA